VSLPTKLRRASILVLLGAFCATSPTGCGGGPAVPTKIYEGGGTAPEVVDQPTKPTKASKGSPRR
jgi:hypothetical protein